MGLAGVGSLKPSFGPSVLTIVIVAAANDNGTKREISENIKA
jgi:hypothetical protein